MIMIPGNSKNLTVLLQGLSFEEKADVSVVYIGPVPRFPMLAFVLVLEKMENKPAQYTEEWLTTLFGIGQMKPCEIITFCKEKKKRVKQAIRFLQEYENSGM